MNLIGLLITLVILGLIWYLSSTLPLPNEIKTVITVVIILILILYLLGLLGIVNYPAMVLTL